MEKVVSLFPSLKTINIDKKTPVKTVNDFKAIEVVRYLCKFQFEVPPTIKACLSFWYLTDENDWPLVGEFSFDYDAADNGKDGDNLEMYPYQVVEGANSLFRVLQGQAGWVNLDMTTKTSFALAVL